MSAAITKGDKDVHRNLTRDPLMPQIERYVRVPSPQRSSSYNVQRIFSNITMSTNLDFDGDEMPCYCPSVITSHSISQRQI